MLSRRWLSAGWAQPRARQVRPGAEELMDVKSGVSWLDAGDLLALSYLKSLSGLGVQLLPTSFQAQNSEKCFVWAT